jgi:hypothetical protein
MRSSGYYRLPALAKAGCIIFFLLGILIAFTTFFELRMNNNNVQLAQFIMVGGVIGGCSGIGIGLVVHFGLDSIASFLSKMNPGDVPELVILMGQVLGSIEGIIIGYLTLRWVGAGNGAVLGWFVGGCMATLAWQARQYHIAWTLVSFIIGLLMECAGGLIIRSIIMVWALVPPSRVLIILLLLELLIVVYLTLSKIRRLLRERQ